MYDPMQLLGKAIKQARLERGLTQSDVAERIDVDVRTVLKIENQKGNPKMDTRKHIIFDTACKHSIKAGFVNKDHLCGSFYMGLVV